MPTAEIEVLDIRKGYVLNDMTALHLKALRDFTDVYGEKRKAGQEWLVNNLNFSHEQEKKDTKKGKKGNSKDVHIIDAHEDLVQEKKIIVLA